MDTRESDPRPKLHFLTHEQLLVRYPEAQTFIGVAASSILRGVFLNEHQRPLLQ